MDYVSGLVANLYNLSSEKALKIAKKKIKNHGDFGKLLGDFPKKVGEKRETEGEKRKKVGEKREKEGEKREKEGEKREKEGDLLRYLARIKHFQERRGKTLMGLLFSNVKMGHGIFHLKNLVKRVISCRFAAKNATP